jgi:hypothetical protein
MPDIIVFIESFGYPFEIRGNLTIFYFPAYEIYFVGRRMFLKCEGEVIEDPQIIMAMLPQF